MTKPESPCHGQRFPAVAIGSTGLEFPLPDEPARARGAAVRARPGTARPNDSSLVRQTPRDKAAARQLFMRVIRLCPVPRKAVTDPSRTYPTAKSDAPAWQTSGICPSWPPPA